MNSEIRSYIESNLQPWRLPPEDRSFLGDERTRPITVSSKIEQYYEKYFSSKATKDNVESLFESELIGIYENLVSCLSAKNQKKLHEHCAFGTCFSLEPCSYATNLLDGYAILWDFRFDDLLVYPSTLKCAISAGLINPYIGHSLINTCIASAGFDRGFYREPLVAGLIDRNWINHIVWGMCNFVIAHEISHIVLGHLDSDEDPALFDFVTSSDEQLLGRLKSYPKGHKKEFDADYVALSILIAGIESEVITGFDRFNESPFDGLLQSISWFFTILTCRSVIGGILEQEISAFHPNPLDRLNIVSGTLLSQKGKYIKKEAAVISSTNQHIKNAHEMQFVLFEKKDDFIAMIDANSPLKDFYDPEAYMKWLNENRK